MTDYVYDPEADRRRIKRKRDLANALLARSTASYSPVIDAGKLMVPNWGDAVANVANAWAARQAEKDADRDESETSAAEAAYTSKATQAYQAARKGGEPYYAGDDTRALDEQGEGATPEPVLGKTGPNPARAMAIAIRSKIPALLKTAYDDDKEDAKLLTVPGATVDSRVAARTYGDPSLLRQEPKEQVVNGRVIRDGRVVGDYRDTFSAPQQIPGTPPGTIGQAEAGTNKWNRLSPAPGTTVNVGDRLGATAFNERVKAFGEALPVLEKSNELARTMVNALPLVDMADTGFAAPMLVQARKLGLALKLTEDQVGKISSSEGLRSALSTLVFKEIKNLGSGTGLSNTDLQFARDVTLGDLQTDPRAMKNAMRLMVLKTRNENVEHTRQLGMAMEAFPDQVKILNMYQKPWAFDSMENPALVGGFEQGSDGTWGVKLEGYTPRDPAAGPNGPTPAGPSKTQAKPAGWSEEKWKRYLQYERSQQ